MLQANLNTILDGPSPKKSRHTEDGQRPAARLESLSTSSTMHSRPGQIPTLANHNPINRTPLPSRREHLPSSGSFIGASTATTSNTNASSQALSTTASRYGQPSRLSTIDDDDNYDCDEEEEEEEVFYDSSPFFPSMTSPTSTSAGAETRSHGGDRHTTSSSREFSHLSSVRIALGSDGTAPAQEATQANIPPLVVWKKLKQTRLLMKITISSWTLLSLMIQIPVTTSLAQARKPRSSTKTNSVRCTPRLCFFYEGPVIPTSEKSVSLMSNLVCGADYILQGKEVIIRVWTWSDMVFATVLDIRILTQGLIIGSYFFFR
jgi:hypothetical protein